MMLRRAERDARKNIARPVGTAEGLLLGAAWNIGGLAFVLASNLMTVPIVINAIGTTGFGQAVFLLALASPMMLLGTILGQAVATLGAARIGSADQEQFLRIIASALLLCLICVVIVGPILMLAMVNLSGAASDETKIVLHVAPITLAGLAFRQFGLIFQGALAAKKNFRNLSVMVVISALVEFAFVLVAMKLMPTVTGYLTALAAGGLLSLCCWLFVMRSEITSIARSNFNAKRSSFKNSAVEFRQLFAFAKWQGASATAGIMVNQSNPLLLGFLSSPTMLAHFNVAARLEQAVTAAFGKLSEVLLPHFGQMAGESSERLGRHFVVASFIMSCAGALLMGPMIAWSQPILSLWINPEFGDAGQMQLRFLATWGLVNMTGSVFTMYALGTGHVADAARIVLQYAVLAVALSAAMIWIAGPQFASLGLVMASIFNAWRRWNVGRTFIEGHARVESGLLTVAPALVAIIAGYFLASVDSLMPESWLGLLWRYAATSIAIFVAIMLAVSLSKEGRKLLANIISIFRSLLNSKLDRAQ